VARPPEALPAYTLSKTPNVARNAQEFPCEPDGTQFLSCSY
jgi:hypothetical protein